MEILSLEQAVYQTGYTKVIAAINKSKAFSKKAKGNINNSQMKQVKNYYIERYNIVEVEGRGADRIFKLDGKRNEILKRIDNRANNKGNGKSLPNYVENHLPILILEYLMRNSNKNDGKMKSLNRHLLGNGIISKEFYDAIKGLYYINSLNKVRKDLLDKDIIFPKEQDIVVDYVSTELNRVREHYMKAISKLKPIILHTKYVAAIVDVPNIDTIVGDANATKQIELSQDIVNKIADLEIDIQSRESFKHLTIQEITTLRFKEDVKKYWDVFNKELYEIEDKEGNQMYITRFYETHAFKIKAGGNQIIKWLESKGNEIMLESYLENHDLFIENNKIAFSKKKSEHMLNLAASRQTKAYNNFVKENKSITEAVNEISEKKLKKTLDLKILQIYTEVYEKLDNYYRPRLY